AVAAVLVGQANGVVILAEQQWAELLGFPQEAVVDDRQGEALAVARRQAEVVARVEPAHALGSADTLGQAGVVQVAGQAKTGVKWRGAGVERLGPGRLAFASQDDRSALVVEVVIGVAGTEVVVTERVATGTLLEFTAEQIAHLREGEHQFRLRLFLRQLL